MKITLKWWVFSVVGAHNQQAFYMFKCGEKKNLKKTKGACSSPISMVFILKILFSFFTRLATLMRRSIVLSLPPQLVFPGKGICGIIIFFYDASLGLLKYTSVSAKTLLFITFFIFIRILQLRPYLKAKQSCRIQL